VEDIMRKPLKILGSIAVAAVFLSAQPASAQQGTPAYNTTTYSDATHTTQVGYIYWVGCDRWDIPYYQLSGSNSNYAVDELVGYCHNGQMEPL
jgi:hypothetical protein